MIMGKEHHIALQERFEDDYANRKIGLEEFQNEMKGLGFDQDEIDTRVKELDQDRNNI